MNQIPYIPETAPFTVEQRAWLNGFLAGLYAHNPPSGVALAPFPGSEVPSKIGEPLIVLYGSQTGTAEGLAKKLAKDSAQRGFIPQVMELNAFEKANLPSGGKAVIISSTWGDGEPPDNATGFWSWLSDGNAPRLENLQFAVLGLGDRNYSEFCGASKKFDERLSSLGAKRLLPRGECDVDYETTAKQWTEMLWKQLAPESGIPSANGNHPALNPSNGHSENSDTVAYSRKNPFAATLLNRRLLNKPGSSKEVFHHEIGLKGSELSYETGDALGVYPKNCPELVTQILASMGSNGEESIDADRVTIPFREALTSHFDVSKPPIELIEKIANLVPEAEFVPLLAPDRSEDLKKWLHGRDLADLVKIANNRLPVLELIPFLRKLSPRLYSISSSPKAHPDEVHLTVGAVRYEAHGRKRLGVASTYLADRVMPNEKVRVFVQTSHGFRLPADNSKPVIMVGPGTGIAPFRAFLEDREATEASGKNWLFFGDQKRTTDFLYEEQLTGWVKSGLLKRLDLAFSRDQRDKIYVQDRILENAAELWRWLSEGAYFYVCGDASRMAKDVDKALHTVAEKAGGLSPESAVEFIAKLKSDKRYQRDVY